MMEIRDIVTNLAKIAFTDSCMWKYRGGPIVSSLKNSAGLADEVIQIMTFLVVLVFIFLYLIHI